MWVLLFNLSSKFYKKDYKLNIIVNDLSVSMNFSDNLYDFLVYLIYLKDYQCILDWFKANNIDLWYFEYKNLVNSVFHRKTVRVFSSWLLPIYFWSVIPNNILQHQRLAGKTINYDLHPLG